MSAATTLRKKGLRNEWLWTRPFMYRRKWLRRFPVWLDTRALEKSQYWPREKIQALQDERIRSLMKDAARLPFWHERFDAAQIDLLGTLDRSTIAKLPLVSKKDFFDRKLEEFSDLITNPIYWPDQTSGSTGQPFSFFQDSHYELGLYGANERMIRIAGHGTRYHFATVRGRWQPGSFLTNGTYFHVHGYNTMEHRLPALQELIAEHAEGMIAQMFSSTLLHLAYLADEKGLELPLRAIIGMGEGLTDAQRKHIERALKTELFMTYGSNEIGRIGFECEHHRMHVNEERLYIEITDEAGRTVPDDTEGKIIFTTFDNRAMPFIRYDVGDVGIIDADPCPCGRTLRTVRIKGRKLSLVEFKDGRQVSLLDLSSSFDSFWDAVLQYQVVRTDEFAFRLKIVPAPAFEDRRDKLVAQIARILHPHAQIEIEIVNEIAPGPNGKAVYFKEEKNVAYV